MTAELAIPPGTPPADAYWVHEDKAGISQAAARGLARAERGDWSSGSAAQRISEFRATLVYRSWLAASFSGNSGVNSERGALLAAPDYSLKVPGNERSRALGLIGRTPVLMRLATERQQGAFTPAEIFKTGAGDVGALPLAAIAIVTIVVAVAESAAVAYCAHEAKQLIDNWLGRDQALKGLAQADAQTLRVLDDHAAREKEEGKALEFNEGERRALDNLETRQKDFSKKATADTSADSGLPWWVLPTAVAAGVGSAIIFSKF